MKKAIPALAAAFAVAAAAQVTQAATYKIGVASPMTGDQAQVGADILNGVKLAAQEWNRANPDRRMEIVIGDDQHDPKQAVAVANKFVNEGVIAVIGHGNSSTSIPVSPIYMDNNMLQINPAATNPKVTDRGLWNVFRVCGRDDQQGKVAADFVAAKRGMTRVAIVHDKTSYGQGLADAFRDALKKDHKIEPVFYGGITQGDKDFSAAITSAKAAGPQIIYYGGMFPEGALLAKQSVGLNVKAHFMGGDGLMYPDFLKIAGKAAAEGSWLTFSPDIKNVPEAKSVVEAYERQFGPVGSYSIYGYAAAEVLFGAIKATGARGTRDSKKIADYIRTRAWNTALGQLRFDEKGDITESPFVVYEVKDGEFIQITGLKQQAAN